MENQTEWKEMRRVLRTTRVFCILNVLLTVGLLVVILFILTEMQPLVRYVEETQTVMDKLAKLDVTALNKTMKRLEKVDFEVLTDTVDALDVDELNEIMEQMSIPMKGVDVDLEALTAAIQDLSEIMETLKSLDNKWGGFLGVTG